VVDEASSKRDDFKQSLTPAIIKEGSEYSDIVVTDMACIVEMCVRFLFPSLTFLPYKFNPLVCLPRDSIVDCKGEKQVSLIEYYTMFTSVGDLFVRGMNGGLNMRDKLAERVNYFMMTKTFCVLSLDVLDDFLLGDTFYHDFEYLIELNTMFERVREVRCFDFCYQVHLFLPYGYYRLMGRRMQRDHP
jgi:hypothetical protein